MTTTTTTTTTPATTTTAPPYTLCNSTTSGGIGIYMFIWSSGAVYNYSTASAVCTQQGLVLAQLMTTTLLSAAYSVYEPCKYLCMFDGVSVSSG